MTNVSTFNRIILLLSLLVFITSVWRLAIVSKDHLAAPFDLAFETPNLSTVKVIDMGKNIYDPATYTTSPFVLTLYTPAYHYLVSWLPKDPENKFLTGRIVSLVFMVAASFSLFFPNRFNHNTAVSLLAISSFFLIREVVSHTAYLRQDSMALFFSAASVISAEKAGLKPEKIAVTALLALIAFTAKQSYLAASISIFFYFLAKNRRAGFQFALFSTTALALLGLFAQINWGEGFWFSIVVAPMNPFAGGYFFENISHMFHQPIFTLLFIFVLIATVIALINEKTKIVNESPYFLYMLFSFVILLATIGKEGANVNYFFEPILASLLWLVYCVRNTRKTQMFRAIPLACVLVMVCLSVEWTLVERQAYSFTTAPKSEKMQQHLHAIRTNIRNITPENPRVLNLAWAGLTLSIQNEPYMNDLFLYSILWNTDTLAIKPFIDEITQHNVDIIILRKDQYRKKVFNTPYDFMIGTILSNYSLAKEDHYCYMVPKIDKSKAL